MSNAALLDMQAPKGVPKSPFFDVVSDPLIPSNRTSEMLAHFFDQVYDLSPESHLSRLLKVVLGDTGTGQLRKRYTYAHLSHFLLTTHYYDLDALYSDIFGIKRFVREKLNINPYLQAATDAEWEAIDVADASYRNRIEAFGRATQMAGTVDGMALAASAVLGHECRVYETDAFVDDGEYVVDEVHGDPYTYGDLQEFTYADLSLKTYADLEGTPTFFSRLPGTRGEFIIRPMRPISNEEEVHLVRTLRRLQPAGSLLTVDTRAVELYSVLPVRRAAASSTYWHIQSLVQPSSEQAQFYDRSSDSEPLEQPRPAFSAYQGEAWSYNGDVVEVVSSTEDEFGNVIQDINYDQIVDSQGRMFTYDPSLALTDATKLLRGRSVSDGVLSAPVAVRG